MNVTELMCNLRNGFIVEERDGAFEYGKRFNYIYYKISKKPDEWILMAGFNEPVDEPFKIKFMGKYYPTPVRLVGHSHRVISKYMKVSKPKDMNVLSFI